LRVVHTSASTVGQVYLPWINGLLMVAVLILVFAFRSSASLAYAYGMAVTGTITITTMLYLYIAHARWRVPLWLIVVGGSALLGVDLLFVAANLTKLVHGAWLPLLIAITTFTVMITWLRGSTIVTRKRDIAEGPLDAFVDQLSRRGGLLRLPGTAVFLNRGTRTAPLALRANVEHNQVLHEQVVIVTIVTLPIPRAHDSERVEVDPLGRSDDGIIHVTARFGYMEAPDVPRTLRALEPTKTEGSISIDDASYFLSKIDLVKGDELSMPAWQTNLFVATAHLSADAAEFFCLPQDRTLIMGSRIEV
jgi:KUP system potassium uptake protein